MGYLCDCSGEQLAKWSTDSVSIIDHGLCPGIDTTQKTLRSFKMSFPSVFTRYNSGEMEVSCTIPLNVTSVPGEKDSGGRWTSITGICAGSACCFSKRSTIVGGRDCMLLTRCSTGFTVSIKLSWVSSTERKGKTRILQTLRTTRRKRAAGNALLVCHYHLTLCSISNTTCRYCIQAAET